MVVGRLGKKEKKKKKVGTIRRLRGVGIYLLFCGRVAKVDAWKLECRSMSIIR